MRGSPSTPGASRRRGFTLVELIVALLLVDVALLALVGAAAGLTRRLGASGARLRALGVATARLERIASRSCLAAASGDTAWSTGIHEWWTIVPRPGGTLDVADSAVYSVGHGRTRVVALHTRVTC